MLFRPIRAQVVYRRKLTRQPFVIQLHASVIQREVDILNQRLHLQIQRVFNTVKVGQHVVQVVRIIRSLYFRSAGLINAAF